MGALLNIYTCIFVQFLSNFSCGKTVWMRLKASPALKGLRVNARKSSGSRFPLWSSIGPALCNTILCGRGDSCNVHPIIRDCTVHQQRRDVDPMLGWCWASVADRLQWHRKLYRKKLGDVWKCGIEWGVLTSWNDQKWCVSHTYPQHAAWLGVLSS